MEPLGLRTLAILLCLLPSLPSGKTPPPPKPPTSQAAHLMKTTSCLLIALQREAWHSRPTTDQILLSFHLLFLSFLHMRPLHWPPSRNNLLSPRPPRHKCVGISSSLILSVFFCQSHTRAHHLSPPLHPLAPCTSLHQRMSYTASSLSVHDWSPPD